MLKGKKIGSSKLRCHQETHGQGTISGKLGEEENTQNTDAHQNPQSSVLGTRGTKLPRLSVSSVKLFLQGGYSKD